MRGNSAPSFPLKEFRDLYAKASRCAYCGCRLTQKLPDGWRPTDATLDHVQALSKGGSHAAHNVVIACAQCNMAKRVQAVTEWDRPRRQRRLASRPDGRQGTLGL